VRHQAAADVWATAQLWLKATHVLQQEGVRSWREHQHRASAGRWIRKHQTANL
jgi:hypothetical protein